MILTIKLLLAHLIGDFLLQPDSWVKDKEEKKQRSVYLYLHVAIHFILAWAVSGELDFWPMALLLAVVHGLIDFTKLRYQTESSKRRWFVTDQLLHLLSIIFLGSYVNGFLYLNAPDDSFWYVFTAAVFLTKPASILIKTLISAWVPSGTANVQSLSNAGNYIGMLERIFVLCFILTGHFDAIGFLLGAKSIFRFGDLTAGNDRQLTEYVLIGTLLSFGLAIFTGLALQSALADLF